MTKIIAFTITAVVLATTPSVLRAQDGELPAETSDSNQLPSVYIQVGADVGVGLLLSPEIKGLLNDDFGLGLGFHKAAVAVIGYQHYAQVEFRYGDSGHTMNNNQFVKGDLQTVEQIPMDYDYTEFVAKVNPLFGKKRSSTIFLLAGIGHVEYFDTEGDGFTGSSLVFGIEVVQSLVTSKSKLVKSLVFGYRRQQITFETIQFFNIPLSTDIAANNNIIYVGGRIGLGI